MILVARNVMCAINSDAIYYYGKRTQRYRGLTPPAYQIFVTPGYTGECDEFTVLGEYDTPEDRDRAFDRLIEALGEESGGVYHLP